MNDYMLNPVDIFKKYSDNSVNKAKTPILRVILLGMLAGAFISIGAIGSSVSMYCIEDVGVSRTVGGVVFPIGLMFIMLLGGELFTGNCLMIMGVVDGKIKVKDVVKNLLIVFVSNFIGALILSLLIVYSGEFNYSNCELGAYVIKTAVTKVNIKFPTAVVSGILCNILVCCAVLMAIGAKDMSGKIFAIFFPIFVFVICGFEHCVANMYYLSAGILAKGNIDYHNKAMEIYGFTEAQLAGLNWKNMFLHNILPVTLGNIIGGMVFVGIPMAILYKDKKKNDKKC